MGLYSRIENVKHINDPTVFAISVSLRELLSAFLYFQRNDLRQMCELHGVRLPFGSQVKFLHEMLSQHVCIEKCNPLLYVFRVRKKPRASAKVRLIQHVVNIPLNYARPQRRIIHHGADSILQMDESQHPHASGMSSEQIGDEEQGSTEDDYLEIADWGLKKTIISEWEEATKTDAQKRLVCAVCARRTLSSEISSLPASVFPLHLLRNDELPEKVMPTTYNFTAYNRALLHPSGLENRERLGNILVCHECERCLCHKKEMPKYSLANWLYYGFNELPTDVGEAFNQATRFDLRLIARAKASRICVRFTDLPSRQPGDTRPVLAQRFNRGNVMVLPQDVTEMSDLLPPGPESLKDTMSVLFVANR